MLEITKVLESIQAAAKPRAGNVELDVIENDLTIVISGVDNKYCPVKHEDLRSLRNPDFLKGMIESIREVIKRKGMELEMNDHEFKMMFRG